MNQSVLIGILIPFTGTTLGALCVYFMKQEMPLRDVVDLKETVKRN